MVFRGRRRWKGEREEGERERERRREIDRSQERQRQRERERELEDVRTNGRKEGRKERRKERKKEGRKDAEAREEEGLEEGQRREGGSAVRAEASGFFLFSHGLDGQTDGWMGVTTLDILSSSFFLALFWYSPPCSKVPSVPIQLVRKSERATFTVGLLRSWR